MKVKLLYLFYFVLFLINNINVFCYAQTYKKNDDIINIIREKYVKINSQIKNYSKKKILLYDEATEGSELTAYYDDKELKKIMKWSYGETEKEFTEYYYADNKFFFVYSKRYIYELKQDENNIYPDREKIATIEENRWYFSNQKLIRWICGKTFMEKNSNDFIKYDWYFSKIFYRYIDIFVNGNIEKNGAVLRR